MNILVLEKKVTFFNIIGIDTNRKGINFHFIHNINFCNLLSYLKDIDLVISISYDNQSYNYVILEAKKRNILTGLIIDGPLEWSNTFNNVKLKIKGLNKLYQPIIHDIVYCISTEQLDILKSWNPNKQFYTYKNYRVLINEENKNIHSEFDFLITTATTPYFNEQEKEKLIFLLESIIKYCDEKNISYQTRFFDIELKKLSKNNETSLSLIEHIQKSKCVLCTPSSVILTSMALKKPTAQLIYRDSPLYYQSGWMIFSINNLNNTFNNMLDCDIDRMNFQDFEVKKNISTEDISFQMNENIDKLANDEINKINTIIFENNLLKAILESRWNINIKYFLKKLLKK